ncbi:CheR family methyltransferase [Altererythrobacter lutimaris]|uniref:Protein-glutamate O-methyltransferase CheR n=1 Tax=Altererythrobacter lutimaris TaxID=2743979 RepID=A0A850HC55_9SPHN|nr:protein-glutamate O-methyltransferase CheR [Altererythrobacter lutimaris]NVE94875.1 protein-glutamate O-methyltransferase CheR [Altererythrobacter lutimaris]
MEIGEASYLIIADLLAARTGQQLTESRRWRVGTSLAGLFRERGISNIDQLVCMLASPGQAALADEVVEALLNNETYFFRDRPTFEQLPQHVFPMLAERRKAQRRLQIWCAGCSTGQEAHSLAMQFADNSAQWEGWSIDILGTDISQSAIATAKAGHYSQFEVQRGLGIAQMLDHFEETASGWQMSSETRSIVRFQQHNVLDKPPALNSFDLILCRNVLLYFPQQTRARVFERLSEALSADGILMLGAGETVVGQTKLFAPVADRISLYAAAQSIPAGSAAQVRLLA